tara:strand:+ start:64 stop:276 length:213 start_codon:yes stop_codon:yes gene_type:complete
MAKQKTSRIKRAENNIETIASEVQKMGHYLNLTMNTLNEYIDFKKDLSKFEKHIKETTEKNEKKVDKKEE